MEVPIWTDNEFLAYAKSKPADEYYPMQHTTCAMTQFMQHKTGKPYVSKIGYHIRGAGMWDGDKEIYAYALSERVRRAALVNTTWGGIVRSLEAPLP